MAMIIKGREGATVNFGTIGAGVVAQAIAGHLVAAGHKVRLSNSRGPDSEGDQRESWLAYADETGNREIPLILLEPAGS